eukprot:COSAG05_NODE_155_length_15704_cov_84.777315_6_plen_50_part_00
MVNLGSITDAFSLSLSLSLSLFLLSVCVCARTRACVILVSDSVYTTLPA